MDLLKRFAVAAFSGVEFHFLRYGRAWLATLGVLLVVALTSFFYFSAPRAFVPGTIVVIPKGATGQSIADDLFAARVVAHPDILRFIWRVTDSSSHIPAGAYRYPERENVFRVAYRLATGDYGIAPVRVTFYEGMTARSMAARVAANVPEISASDFLAAAQPYEGYLFPDTYFIPPSADAASVVAMMRANFDEHIASLHEDIAASGHSIGEILTMASLIEKEADSAADRRLIAGVLWNRIEKKMPLQVDAVFGYIFNRETYSPSFDDLTVDSPYNTYTHKGLPPGPIANPGLDAIIAALHPTESAYLFYLTGKDGVTRYAATYEKQLANQRAYLR